MIRSGQGELVIATSAAAINTPTFEITSLREHSNVLAMFTSCRRNRHSRPRLTRFATSAIPPNASISVELGGTPLSILTATLTRIPRPRTRMNAPLNAATPAFHRSLRAIA